MNEVIYAIGDVHGCDDLLETLYDKIIADRKTFYADRPVTLIHVGDYIDRGANSAGVIDRIMTGLPGFESISLMGNHEAMMLACTKSDGPDLWYRWLGNGGEETAKSFGVDLRFGGYDPAGLSTAIGKDRLQWLEVLPLSYRTDDYFFVHAGIRPDRPLNDQRADDLIWIRQPFLDSDKDFGVTVIHGHTPVDEPDIRTNRINIDTGAIFSGKLTALVLDGHREPRFLQTG